MSTVPLSAGAPPADPPRHTLVRRHGALVRLSHWINVLCLAILLMSGAQIFNAHPRLYWGAYGADYDAAAIEIASLRGATGWQGELRLGTWRIPATGVLGASREGASIVPRAFPTWLTLPSYRDLGTGRRWHFFWAWVFVVNGLVYLANGFVRRHFTRDLVPTRGDLAPRHLWHEIRTHARLQFPRGEAARRYNVLQQLTYLVVIFVLLPLMVLSGLAMSPGMDAAFHFLPDAFGGRPSARTVHFISASLLVAFFVVHVAMVIASGLWNNLRSMITGRYAIEIAPPPAGAPHQEDTP